MVKAKSKKKMLSERIIEMQYWEFVSVDANAEYWTDDIRQARIIAENVVSVLDQELHVIKFLGLRIDNSVIQVLATVFAILGYLVFWVAYKNHIVNTSWVTKK